MADFRLVFERDRASLMLYYINKQFHSNWVPNTNENYFISIKTIDSSVLSWHFPDGGGTYMYIKYDGPKRNLF